jgi:hypothetical protein
VQSCCGSLDADLTVDENLALKPSHHYLTKLCKNLLDVSTVGSTSNGPQGSLALLHLRLACIAVVPFKRSLKKATKLSNMNMWHPYRVLWSQWHGTRTSTYTKILQKLLHLYLTSINNHTRFVMEGQKNMWLNIVY